MRFLEWARVRLLLRSTGAAYEWAHLEFRDYMAHGIEVVESEGGAAPVVGAAV